MVGAAVVVPKSVPPPVVVVLPRLASPASPALPAVGNHFFLKNPNFGLGLGAAPAVAVIHSCIFAASHVI